MAVDKAALFRPRCPEEDVELPGVGTVRVRGLTRGQIVEISKGMNEGRDMEPRSLSWALVDPELTEDEARELIQVAPFGEIEAISNTINRLSGIAGRADKEAYKSLPG
ncbi:hypothetical protein AWW66_10960 [Micromonospora rosaria]|uniref:Uncharacterized protein n=1 Tax=Micromonospora rosaria TaxID=47874 RepID=A0A136PU51_9ACTN|nr:hypothetical protein [Micromonospora rosaria]KXK61952.1 hypothetical protein AWW66_10960 [Micromonospora rosaria]